MTTVAEFLSLLPYNTFGFSVSARKFVDYSSSEDLLDYLRRTSLDEPHIQVGNGSNILFLKDYPGTVFHSSITTLQLLRESDDHVWVKVGSGTDWDSFVALCLEREWYGLENLSLIPGTVGGAAVQNIGAYGVQVSQYIEEVEVVDLPTLQVVKYPSSACRYGYRQSVFKHLDATVTHVTFRLSRRFSPIFDYEGLRRAMEGKTDCTAFDIRREIILMRQSKLPDFKQLGNAGSFFLNPEISADLLQQILRDYPSLPHFPVSDGRQKIPAGWLVEQAGCKGMQVGGACVYAGNAMILVNTGNGQPSDVVRLYGQVRETVLRKFGVELDHEVRFV